jgi:hypothetical protein
MPGHPIPYLMAPDEFNKEIIKAEGLCQKPDPTFGSQLSVALWAKKCLEKQGFIPVSHEKEWVLRFKRAGRLAFKTMRKAGEDPILYFPNKLDEYERTFAD